MTVIALCFCVLVVGLAAAGVFAPQRFLDLVRRLTTPQGFYILGILRIAFGAALYVAAPASRLPLVIEVTGIVLVVSGVVTPFFSHSRYRKIIEWWSAGGTLYVRVWAACAAVFGALLAYVLMSKPPTG